MLVLRSTLSSDISHVNGHYDHALSVALKYTTHPLIRKAQLLSQES